MSLTSNILKVGSVARSMSVYLPAVILQKTLGLGRLVLFSYLVSQAELGIWGLGVMVLTVGSPLLCLGSNHGLSRYVGLFEARGKLSEFYRRMCFYVFLLVVGLSVVMALGGFYGLRWLIFCKSESPISMAERNWICWMVFANVTLMALYINALSFMHGLRMYRLASLAECLFSVLFTIFGVGLLWGYSASLSLFIAHAVSLLLTLLLTMWLLGKGVRLVAADVEANTTMLALPHNVPDLEPPGEPDGDVTAGSIGLISAQRLESRDENHLISPRAFIRFGLVGMIAAFIKQMSGYVSYLMVYLYYGDIYAAGVFVVMQLSQPLLFLAHASWAVIFSHVTIRWERGDREGAMFMLETSYKAIALLVMTFTVLLYVTWPYWIRVIDPRYSHIHYYLSGFLTFYVTISNMTMLTIPANLHERPSIIAIGSIAGAALNALLAALWMPYWGEVGAARAAGVGMYFGGGMVMLVYLLASGVRLQDSTYFMLGTPVLLLLPPNWVGVLWAFLLPVCVFSKWIFTPKEKQVLAYSFEKLIEPLRRIVS